MVQHQHTLGPEEVGTQCHIVAASHGLISVQVCLNACKCLTVYYTKKLDHLQSNLVIFAVIVYDKVNQSGLRKCNQPSEHREFMWDTSYQYIAMVTVMLCLHCPGMTLLRE